MSAVVDERPGTPTSSWWSVGSIPFVRAQIARLHGGVTAVRGSDLAQLVAVAITVIAAAFDGGAIGRAVAIAVIAAVQVAWSRRPIPPIKVIGFQQMALGLALVAATAVGFHLT